MPGITEFCCVTHKNVLCLIFTSLTLYSYSQYEPTRQSFFKHIKNYEFEGAALVLQEIKDPSWNQALTLLQQLLFESGQHGKVRLIQDSLAISKIDKTFSEGSGRVIINLLWGYYHFYNNPYTSKPIERFNQAYSLSKKLGTSEEVKFCVHSILRLYNWELSQANDDILVYLDIYEALIEDRSDEFHHQMNDFQYELRDINYDYNLGDLFVEKFQGLMTSFHKDHHFWVEYWITLGAYKRHEGTLAANEAWLLEADQLFHKALNQMGDEPYLRYLKFRTYIQLSELERARNNYQQAIDYILKAKENSYVNDPVRADYWLSRYAAPNVFGAGQADSAFFLLSQADTLRNRLDYQLNSLRISQYKWKFQTQEKEEALQQTRQWLLIAIVILVFVSVVYFLLQLNSRKKRLLAIQDINIQQGKVTNLLKEQELIALNAMVEGQEKERKRIAEDLHDRLGSTLSAVKMYMEVLAEDDPRFDKINGIVNKAVNDTREIAHNMLSGVLTKFGLLAALQDLKETIEASGQFQMLLRSIQFDERLDSETEIHIYRIIQELVSNTLKHANASEVKLELKKTSEKQLIITYRDNGIGFDPDQIEQGMGFKNIRNRVEKIRGNLRVDSRPTHGVEIIIELWKIE